METNKKGFTIIELLVVIAMIGLLSSVIFASLNSTRKKAAYAKVQAELDQFRKAAIIAQGESGKTLIEITASNCSACSCTGRDVKNIPTSDQCYILWVSALTKIQNATGGIVSGLDKMTRDPWNSPYGLDENEREGGPTDCRLDYITTVGPDGIYGTGDDLGVSIPHSRTCP